MAQSNQSDSMYNHKQCNHGRCSNHQPDWEEIGAPKMMPNPGIFGQKTYWTIRCCGKAMTRYKLVQTLKCRKCGANSETVKNYYLADCQCCGYTSTIMHYDYL